MAWVLTDGGNAFRLDPDSPDGTDLQAAPIKTATGLPDPDQWVEPDYHMLPEDLNEALGRIRAALLSLPPTLPTT